MPRSIRCVLLAVLCMVASSSAFQATRSVPLNTRNTRIRMKGATTTVAEMPSIDSPVSFSVSAYVNSNNNDSITQAELTRFIMDGQASTQEQRKPNFMTATLDRFLSQERRDKLSKKGINVVLGYALASNICTVLFGTLTWYLFATQSGMSPFAPNQWKAFGKIYASMYLIQATVVRPFRVAAALALAPKVDSFLTKLQRTFQIQRRSVAIAWMVLFVNVVGTCTCLFGGVQMVSWVTGVPIFS